MKKRIDKSTAYRSLSTGKITAPNKVEGGVRVTKTASDKDLRERRGR